MTASTVMQQFVSGLKSKNEDVRFRTTRDLHHYVTTELREMSIEDVSAFLDEFNHHIFEMVSSSDVNDRKGGTLAIAADVDSDYVISSAGELEKRVLRNKPCDLLKDN
ncbi:Serine/threonine-protein kinase mTOR [Araneus ventricosus]|uniref:Serine/threonine-protein kinase mTOR n=1 Tax=Araneus ventricosus TaxID=182803 RepID=A0A4Y2R2N1_ARAVE|nr:Serine/threonine-protein kinase mTOR [Araneus ventricosus]